MNTFQRLFLTVLLILAGVLVTGIANAGFLGLAWEPPITRTDNSPLSLDEIARYEFGCGAAGATGPFDQWRYTVNAAGVTPHPTRLETDIPDQTPDVWCVAYTIDTGERVSPRSQVAHKQYVAPPGSPVGELQFYCYGTNCNYTINFGPITQ